jgi:hypothetical protein
MTGMTAEQLAEEKMVKSRNSRSVKKLRDYISEALSQAFAQDDRRDQRA